MVTIRDLAWTAGFLEGEGSFLFVRYDPGTHRHGAYSRPQLCAYQVQRQPLEKLQALFGGSIWLRERNGVGAASPIWRWTLDGAKAAELMMTLYVLMSPKRQEQISIGLAKWRQITVTRRPSHSPVCLNGHWLAELGLTTSGGCRKCARNSQRAYQQRRMQK